MVLIEFEAISFIELIMMNLCTINGFLLLGLVYEETFKLFILVAYLREYGFINQLEVNSIFMIYKLVTLRIIRITTTYLLF